MRSDNITARIKKRKPNQNEKRKSDYKQNWVAAWTIAKVKQMFMDLWQQQLWYWPPTIATPLTSSAPSNGWRLSWTLTNGLSFCHKIGSNGKTWSHCWLAQKTKKVVEEQKPQEEKGLKNKEKEKEKRTKAIEERTKKREKQLGEFWKQDF